MNWRAHAVDAYDYLFCLLIFSIPFSLKIPNAITILLLLLFIADFKSVQRSDFVSLCKRPLIIMYCFVLYLLTKAILTGSISENKYSLLVLLSILPILFIKLKRPIRLLVAVVIMTLVAIIISAYGLLDNYLKTKELLPFEGTRINEILAMERPYLAFLCILAIASALHLSYAARTFRVILIGFIALATLFIFIISARIASLTIVLIAVIYFAFYIRISWKRKLGMLAISLVAGLILILSVRTLRERLFITENYASSVAKLKRHEPRVIIWPCAYDIALGGDVNPVFGFVSEERLDELLADCYDKTMTDRERANYFIETNHNTHNQFINIYLTSGAFGLLLMIMFFASEFYLNRTSFVKTSVLVSIFLIFLVENLLHRQTGIYFFAIALAFLNLYDGNRHPSQSLSISKV